MKNKRTLIGITGLLFVLSCTYTKNYKDYRKTLKYPCEYMLVNLERRPDLINETELLSLRLPKGYSDYINHKPYGFIKLQVSEIHVYYNNMFIENNRLDTNAAKSKTKRKVVCYYPIAKKSMLKRMQEAYSISQSVLLVDYTSPYIIKDDIVALSDTIFTEKVLFYYPDKFPELYKYEK